MYLQKTAENKKLHAEFKNRKPNIYLIASINGRSYNHQLKIFNEFSHKLKERAHLLILNNKLK